MFVVGYKVFKNTKYIFVTFTGRHLKLVLYRLTSVCAQQEKNCLSVLTPSLRGEPGMLNIPVNHRMSADDNHLQTVHEEEVSECLAMLDALMLIIGTFLLCVCEREIYTYLYLQSFIYIYKNPFYLP